MSVNRDLGLSFTENVARQMRITEGRLKKLEHQEIVGSVKIVERTVEAINIAVGTITATEIKAATITGNKIAADTIEAGNIAANAITTSELAANSVTSEKIVAGTIEASDIKSDTITATQIAANAITTSELAANSVTSEKIVAGTIEASDIKSETITATQIAAGTITATQIASGTITGGNIASGTITAGKITISELSALSANLGTITAGTVTGATLRTAASGKRVVLNSEGLKAFNALEQAVLNFDISTGNLSIKGAIEAGSTVPASTVTGKLTNAQLEAIEAAKITGTITETQVDAEAISTPKLKAGAVTAAKITADTITAAEIAAGAITTSELAANSVTSEKIVAGTIEAGDIKSETITAAQIAASTITATQIAATTITGEKIAASTITAAKLNVTELSAITANLGSITAGTITGATFRTASTNPKVQMDSEGLKVISNAGTNQLEITKEGLFLTEGEAIEGPRTIQWKSGGSIRSEITGNVGGAISILKHNANRLQNRQAGAIYLQAFDEAGKEGAVYVNSDKTAATSKYVRVRADTFLKTLLDGEQQSNWLQQPVETASKRVFVEGNVTAAGALTSGDGFTVVRNSQGKYTVTFKVEMKIIPGVSVTPVTATIIPMWTLTEVTKTKFVVQIWNQGSGILADTAFSFVAIG